MFRSALTTARQGRGFWGFARELWQEISEDRIMAVAAGVCFYVLLAAVPAITALVSLFGLIATPEDSQAIFTAASDFLPEEAATLLTDQAVRIAGKADDRLSFAAILSLALALWSANIGTRALIEALGIAWGRRDERNFFIRNLMSLITTLGGLFGVIVVSVLVGLVPVILGYLGLGALTEALILILRWPFVLVLLLTGLSILYQIAPDHRGHLGRQRRYRWLTPGTATGAVLILIGSVGFGWYVASFGSYDETYGSLSAVAVTMIWVWLSMTFVLIGAEVDALVERRRAAARR